MAFRLTWTNNNGPDFPEDGFKVYRDIAPMDPSALPAPLATLPADTTQWDDVSPLADAYYRVAAYKGATLAVSDELHAGVGGVGLGYASYTPVAGAWGESHVATPDTSTYVGGIITLQHVGDNNFSRWNIDVPAGDFDIVMRANLTLFDYTVIGMGFFAGTSSGADQLLKSLGYLFNGSYAHQWWRASNNSFVSENRISNVVFPSGGKIEYWRITRVGTTLTWFRSDDGLVWTQMSTEPEASFGGAVDRVGFMLNTYLVSSGVVNTVVLEGYDTTGPQPEATS